MALTVWSGRADAQLTATAIVTPATCGNNNGTITVQASGGTPNYLYEIGTGSNFQVDPTFGLMGPGTWTITVQDATVPVAQRFTFTVTIADARGPAITSVPTVDALCSGTDGIITINATGGAAPLQYSIDGGTTFQSSNVFNNVPSGTFTAVVQDANMCRDTKAGEIFKQCLQLLVHGTDPSCANNDGTITAVAASGFPPYTYSIDGINFQSSPDFTGLAAGDYRIYVLDSRAQASAAPWTLLHNCLQATLTPADATCGKDNGTIDVSASGDYTPFQYSLDGVTFQDSPQFTGLAPGPYTITVKDDKGNTITAGTTILAAPAPGILAVPTAATCADNDGSLLISGSGGPQPYQYAVDGGSYGASGNFDHLSSGAHLAAVKDASGCEVTQTATIPLNNTLTADGGPDVSICEGKSGVIKAVSNGTSFSWQPVTGLDDANILQPTASPSTNTTYFLTASAGPCKLTVPVNVIVNPAPVAVVAPVDSICYGLSTQLEGSGGVGYSWDPATYLSDPSIPDPLVNKPARSITYRLTVTDAKGCQSLQPAVVTVGVRPPPPVFAGNDTSILAGQPLPLHAVDVSNAGLSGWQWSPAEGLDNSQAQDPVAHPGESVTYTVTAATAAGCGGTASIAVKVFSVSDIFVPNAFTPNGDGHNDVLKAIPVGIKDFRYFAVFDRWGQRIFYTTNPTNGWRGEINGQIQPTGTYIWMAGGINYKGDFVQRKGTVLLIR